MKKARLIKKNEQAEQKPAEPLALSSRTPTQKLANLTQQKLTQWVGTYQNSRTQNARLAFAALFTAEG